MVEEVATQVAVQAKDAKAMKCERCTACEIERIGCGCDGAYDDGCFLCRPQLHQRPACPWELVLATTAERAQKMLSDVVEVEKLRREMTEFEKLRQEMAEISKENVELLAALPRCHYRCPNIGTKWVSRTCLYCDTHGAIYLQDAPWAEYARRKGLAGKHGNVPDLTLPKLSL